MEYPSWLDTASLQKLASEELNGREIKNVVKMALGLAKSDGRNLGMKDIEAALRVFQNFSRDFDKLDRGTKRRALKDGHRTWTLA
jgi:hypothetical protein